MELQTFLVVLRQFFFKFSMIFFLFRAGIIVFCVHTNKKYIEIISVVAVRIIVVVILNYS